MRNVRQSYVSTSIHPVAAMVDTIDPDGVGDIASATTRSCAADGARPHGSAAGGRAGTVNEGGATSRAPRDGTTAGGSIATSDSFPSRGHANERKDQPPAGNFASIIGSTAPGWGHES